MLKELGAQIVTNNYECNELFDSYYNKLFNCNDIIYISCFQFVDNINIFVEEIQPINNSSKYKMNNTSMNQESIK